MIYYYFECVCYNLQEIFILKLTLDQDPLCARRQATFCALPRAENGVASEPCPASEEGPWGGAFLSFPFHLSRCRRARTEGLSRVRVSTDGQWAARLFLGLTLPKLSGIASEEVPCSPEKKC